MYENSRLCKNVVFVEKYGQYVNEKIDGHRRLTIYSSHEKLDTEKSHLQEKEQSPTQFT